MYEDAHLEEAYELRTHLDDVEFEHLDVDTEQDDDDEDYLERVQSFIRTRNALAWEALRLISAAYHDGDFWDFGGPQKIHVIVLDLVDPLLVGANDRDTDAMTKQLERFRARYQL